MDYGENYFLMKVMKGKKSSKIYALSFKNDDMVFTANIDLSSKSPQIEITKVAGDCYNYEDGVVSAEDMQSCLNQNVVTFYTMNY